MGYLREAEISVPPISQQNYFKSHRIGDDLVTVEPKTPQYLFE
jgi:hypothetical protein